MPNEMLDWTTSGPETIRVSVLMTVVRLDDFVRPAIDSVLADLGTSDEFIVVGDGCDIQSLERIYADRIHFIQLPRRHGTPTALNIGIAAARGAFIARLDADDISLPGRFDLQVAEFQARSDLVLLGGEAYIFDGTSGSENRFSVPTDAERLRKTLIVKNSFIHSSVMMSSSALRAVGGYDPQMLRMQDYDLFLRLASRGMIGNIPTPLVKYRVHRSMASRSNSPYAFYTRHILRARTHLATELHVPRAVSMLRNSVWWIAQVLRYHGLRRPRGRAA